MKYDCFDYNIINMPQNRINKLISIPIGLRLEELVILHLGTSWSEFSASLGYKNPSTLHKVKSGESMMSAEKLHELAELDCHGKGMVNINWLLAGKGKPFLEVTNEVTSDNNFDESALITALINILQRSRAAN